ncbi:MAG TPA: hypothetical protein VMH32_19390 [Burkholderiales bacterium]|nr:hypothetical protein [Burkholderiales bacterium]
MDSSADTPEAARERAILAAIAGATANVDWMTSDRIEALTGGHGMLNMPVIAIADALAVELLRGADIEVKFANAVRQPIDDLLATAIDAARAAGADGANAALLSAALLYLAGAQAQVGIPAGNRKLGASARMIAGVDRCGVAAIPTGKKNNKISGFPAVQAIYQAMQQKRLSPIDGRNLPPGVGGGPIYGHSRLGEDIVFPAMAENGARIGTQAMLDAFAGAGMPTQPFTAALFGAAAILEIIHPDADVADQYGPYGKVTSAFVAGSSAARTAGLPEVLHARVTGEEFPTGRLIGDLGLILKDVGGPTVIGMMALDEILQVFEELARVTDPPLGHLCADAVVAFKALLQEGATQDGVAAALAKARGETSIDLDTTMLCMNTVARKASQVRRGPVSETLLLASEPRRMHALYRRAAKSYSELAAGKPLAEVVRDLDRERQATVEDGVSRYFTRKLGKPCVVALTKIAPGARRASAKAQRWLAFDPDIDAEVTLDGVTTRLPAFVHDLVPKVVQGQAGEIAWAVTPVAFAVGELLLAGNTIVNVTIPAAMAAVLGVHSPAEAAEMAERAAYVSAGIPGARARAESAARLARRIATGSGEQR